MEVVELVDQAELQVKEKKAVFLALLSQHQLKQKVVVEEDLTLLLLAEMADLVVVDVDMEVLELVVQQMQLLMADHQLFRVMLVVMVALLGVAVEVVPVVLVLPVQEILAGLVVMEYQTLSELAQAYSMAAVVVEPATARALVMEETVEVVMEIQVEEQELMASAVAEVEVILLEKMAVMELL